MPCPPPCGPPCGPAKSLSVTRKTTEAVTSKQKLNVRAARRNPGPHRRLLSWPSTHNQPASHCAEQGGERGTHIQRRYCRSQFRYMGDHLRSVAVQRNELGEATWDDFLFKVFM